MINCSKGMRLSKVPGKVLIGLPLSNSFLSQDSASTRILVGASGFIFRNHIGYQLIPNIKINASTMNSESVLPIYLKRNAFRDIKEIGKQMTAPITKRIGNMKFPYTAIMAKSPPTSEIMLVSINTSIDINCSSNKKEINIFLSIERNYTTRQ